MFVSKIENALFGSNSYLVEIGENLIIIDPSNEEVFLKKIIETKKTPLYIILTHEHIDHVIGVVKLKEIYNNIKIISTCFTSMAILDPKKNLSIFHGFEFKGLTADIEIYSEYSVMISDDIVIKLYPCKGHSLGGMFIKIKNSIFCGDEFIFKMKTVTKLPGGNRNEVSNSYTFLKSNFEKNTILYPGHGNLFYLEELKIW